MSTPTVNGSCGDGLAGSPIFVVGHPRSGTSLLAAILDRHPEVAVPPETSFFFWPTVRDRKIRGHRALWDSIQRLNLDFEYDDDALRANFESGPASPARLLDVLLSEYASARGKARWGEKSPWHLLHVDRILDWFPNARILITVRDGRDTVESCLNAAFLKRSREWYSTTWRHAARAAVAAATKHADRVLLVRYEALVTAPDRTVDAVDKFLELPFQRCQLDATERSGTFFASAEPWKVLVNQAPDASRAGAWRSTLRPEQVRRCEAIFGPELIALGYSLASDEAGWQRPTPSDRLRGTAYRALGRFALGMKAFRGSM